MMKKISLITLVLTSAFWVVASNVIPHHHHHGDESTICIVDDLHETGECCGGDHHSADGNCCGIKANLITHFGDSRKEDFHCGCDSGHHFHGGDFFILLAFLPEIQTVLTEFLSENLTSPPYSNTYLSALTEGNLGLRAPPIA